MPDTEYIFDTVSISNFALAGALDLIVRRYFGNMFVTSEVHDEILEGIAGGHWKLEEIETLLDRGAVKLIHLDRKEHELYKIHLTSLGRGKASCISVAFHRKMVFASDDRAARLAAREIKIRITGTVGILKAAVSSGQLLLSQADDILAKMIAEGFYSPVNSISQIE
ncbi:MAG: hypothetical protein WC637_16600 [Victivallales bacterium]|jgi:predicted nucleic acid-binding protein